VDLMSMTIFSRMPQLTILLKPLGVATLADRSVDGFNRPQIWAQDMGPRYGPKILPRVDVSPRTMPARKHDAVDQRPSILVGSRTLAGPISPFGTTSPDAALLLRCTIGCTKRRLRY